MNLIPITSPEHCLDTFKSLKNANPKDPEVRLLRFSASNYYFEKAKAFNEQQIKIIFSFPEFISNLSGKYIKEILTNCVKEKKVFPVIIKDWFTNIKNPELDKYIELLYEKKEYKQLNEFLKHKPQKIEHLFISDKNPTPEIINIALKINSKNILFVQDKEFVINFLKSKKYKIVELAAYAYFDSEYQIVIKNKEVKEIIFARLIEHFIKNKTDKKDIFHSDSLDKEPDFVRFLKQFPIDYIKYFEKKEFHFLNEQLAKPIKVNNVGHDYKTNLAQYIYTEKIKTNSPDCKEFLDKYFNLIIKPITEDVFGYQSLVDPLEFHLRKKNVDFILTLKDKYELLDEKQKQIFLAGAFKYFSISKNGTTHSIIEVLNNVPHTDFIPYYVKTKGELSEIQQDVIEKLITKMKIDSLLPLKQNKPLFRKI